MYNGWWLYQFELRKIISRKTVWILFLFISLGLFISVIAVTLLEKDANGMSVFEKNKLILAYEKTQKGTVLNDTSFYKTKQVLSEKDQTTGEYYYYEGIKSYLQTEVGKKLEEMTMQDFYSTRQENMKKNMLEMKLTASEIKYWSTKEKEIEKPFVYHPVIVGQQLWKIFYEAVVFLLLAIAIGLANVFADETHFKMTPLHFSTSFGMKKLFYSKIAAGLTFSLICAGVVVLSLTIPILFLYKSFGLDQPITMVLAETSLQQNIGQMINWYVFVFCMVSILFGMLTMFGSEVFQNGVAILGVMFALLLFGMVFHVPNEYRFASQLFSLFPTDLLGVWSVYDYRLFHLFGKYFTGLEMAPFLYGVISVLLFLTGSKMYRRFDFSS